ncbi:MBL fold metallo-hydrolase [Flavobacterium aquicola]|uniref:Metallo-beta-lactamase superfamily protein n=1 Tax=Flavobacterium aquicola TaxID=1682742 RepID=A0A3E0EP15_9FLAO|nr:MBL fold metallo-hydrolase [Flavobacterium aquicola]REG99483.1 metallo-beta-lactamase superfamily protein [Flavobacterium aquicola]
MNRRDLIKKVALAGILTAVPFSEFYGAEKEKEKEVKDNFSGFQKVKMGDLTIYILSDGYLREDDIKTYAPKADAKELKNLLKANFRPADHIDMAINVPLVQTRDRLILFDSGMGIFADERTGFLQKSLSKAGFARKDITDVFISHAHIDHIGGLIDKNDALVYPNAVYHISKREFDFWMNAEESDFTSSYLINEPKKIQFLVQGAQKVLKVIESKTTFFDFSSTLYSYFSFESAQGHTPGMTMISVQVAGKKLTYIADLSHSDVLLFSHPEWGFFADTDIQMAARSRRDISGQLAENGNLALGYHLPWPGLGNVAKAEENFRWIPYPVYRPGEIEL